MAFLENLGKTVVSDIMSNYFFGGVATVIGITLVAKSFKGAGRGCLVAATKEVISFKQWLSGTIAEGKEFCADITAEAKQQYMSEVDRRLNILQQQTDLLQKLKASI